MKITHLAYWVQDLEGIRSFYEKYFGAKAGDLYVNPQKGFRSYFLRFDEGAELEIMQMPSIEDENSVRGKRMGLAHVAISVGSEQAVDDLTERLRQEGFTVEGEPRRTGDGYYESVILDPESNFVEITV